MTGENTGVAIGATGLALFAGAMIAIKVGALDAFITTAAPVGLVVLIGVGAIGLVSQGARSGGRNSHAHTRVVRRGRHVEVHSAPVRASSVTRRRRIAADHEAGHAAVARARGWRVNGVEIRDDGSGVTRMTVPWLKSYDPRDDIAVSLAGGKAARTQVGCGSDNAYAEAARNSVPEDQRDAAWREGNRRADSALFWRSGQRHRDSQALQKRGQL
jgi:hypothetical protein